MLNPNRALPWLTWRARKTPRAPALITGGAQLSWGELHARVQAAAAALSAKGLRARGRAVLALPSGADFVTALFAVWRLGACAVPLNLRLPAAERARQLQLLSPHLVLESAADLACGAAAETTAVRAHAADDNALILFTSGTSGAPKAACLRFRNLEAAARASARRLGTGAASRWLLCLPLFHIGGVSVLVRAVLTGACVVLQPRFCAAAASQALDECGVTHVSLVPTTLKRLLNYRGARPAPHALKCVLLGGAAASPALLARARAAGFAVRASYGLTETAAVIACARAHDPPDGGCGAALPGGEIRIAPGEGEIEVRGRGVFAGYWRDPQATARAFRGEWFRTGDIGRMDSAGRLHVLDRRDDAFVCGGENVYPAQVEAALLEHAAVAEAAVWRRPDADLDFVPVAWVVPQARNADAKSASLRAALARHCRARLAGYQRPREFHFVAELPRNAMGKVLRRKLSPADN